MLAGILNWPIWLFVLLRKTVPHFQRFNGYLVAFRISGLLSAFPPIG